MGISSNEAFYERPVKNSLYDKELMHAICLMERVRGSYHHAVSLPDVTLIDEGDMS